MTTLNPIDTVKRVKAVNDIAVLTASKRSPIPLIGCITVAKSPLSKPVPLQAHSEGSSLRGVSRTSGLAYGTVVSIIRASSVKAQLIHNQQVQAVETEEIGADEFWSFVKKSKSSVNRTQPKLETVGSR